MTSLKSMKKDQLIEKVSEYEKTVADLKIKVAAIKIEDSPQDINSKTSSLIAEINRLKDELKTARETEKFVAIENLSLGRVWLYAPESKSGRLEDANKGRLLKQTGELAIIPSYWMATYIADRAPAFEMGELRLNNDKGRSLSPHLVFEDYKLPKEFLDAAVSNESITKAISGLSEDFYSFVEKHKKNIFVLNRAFGVIDRAAYAAEEKSKEKSILDGYVTFLQDIIHPKVEEKKERDEARVVI